nr:hypothetical protein [uncultured Carboxylicivirga sp.]
MTFRASFCHPFKSDIIEYGTVESDRIIEAFEKVPWTELLNKMQNAKDSEIHYSPSFEIENIKNKNGLAISALDGGEWYIFYKRPKKVKILFGLIERMNDNYVTEIHGQTEKDAKECLEALLKNNFEFLDNKIK